MDITALLKECDREDEGVLVHIASAAGEPLFYGDSDDQRPVTIRVAGRYSDARVHRSRLLRRGQQNRLEDFAVGSRHLKDQTALVAACILSWDGFFYGDTPFDLTRDNAIAVLESAYWIREQVVATMTEEQQR